MFSWVRFYQRLVTDAKERAERETTFQSEQHTGRWLTIGPRD